MVPKYRLYDREAWLLNSRNPRVLDSEHEMHQSWCRKHRTEGVREGLFPADRARKPALDGGGGKGKEKK